MQLRHTPQRRGALGTPRSVRRQARPGLPDSGEGEASASLCTSSAGGSSTLSSSGPHRLFRFLFTLAVGAGFPGAAADGFAVGSGADEVGQAVVVGVDPSGVSGGDLRFSPRSGAVGLPM